MILPAPCDDAFQLHAVRKALKALSKLHLIQIIKIESRENRALLNIFRWVSYKIVESYDEAILIELS